MLKESSNLLHQTVNFKIDGDYFYQTNTYYFITKGSNNKHLNYAKIKYKN